MAWRSPLPRITLALPSLPGGRSPLSLFSASLRLTPAWPLALGTLGSCSLVEAQEGSSCPTLLKRLDAQFSLVRDSGGKSPTPLGMDREVAAPAPGGLWRSKPQTCTLRDHIIQASNRHLLMSLSPHFHPHGAKESRPSSSAPSRGSGHCTSSPLFPQTQKPHPPNFSHRPGSPGSRASSFPRTHPELWVLSPVLSQDPGVPALWVLPPDSGIQGPSLLYAQDPGIQAHSPLLL